MRTYFRISLAILISIYSLTFLSTPSSNALELTRHGQDALAQIAECVNRDDKDSLNVLYLLDESKSLTWNDPDDIRTDALISSLKQFADASVLRPHFKISRTFTTFANAFKVRKPWQPINESNFEKDREWILQNVPNLENGSATDWEIGLRGALAEFNKVQSPTSCEILVWFTDGGINVAGDSKNTRDSLTRLCGVNPQTGAKNSDALINVIRDRGIWIQGILLRNQNVFENPTIYDLTAEDIQSEKSRMSYFAVVVEQSGAIDPYFFDSSTSQYQCGENIESFGLVQTVEDPVDIIWPTQQFNCMSSGGRVIKIKGNTFTIDPGITKFSVTAYSQGFKVFGSNGEQIANSQGAVKGNVQLENLNSSNSVLRVSGDVSQQQGLSTSAGKWKIDSAANDKAVVCAFLDLELQVSTSTCYSGENCEFTGVFVRQGLEANLENFSSKKLQVGELVNSRSELPLGKLDGSTFRGSFTPTSGTSEINLGVVLTLKTQSGIEFVVSTKKPIPIIPPGVYPTITPDPIKTSDFSESLKGKKGEALTSLRIEGPSRTAGQICLGPIQVRSDVQPKRIELYSTFFNGSEVTSEKCYSLDAGEIIEVELGIKNPLPANGTSKGFMIAKYQVENQPEISSKLDVQFETNVIYDTGARWIIFIALMLLGIGLPLAGLYAANTLNAKIIANNLYVASIPVLVSASGGSVILRRLEGSDPTSIIRQEDFVPFSSGLKKSKEIQIGSESLRAHSPKSPFGRLRSTLTTTDSSVIVSSSIDPSKGLMSNQAPGALNPAGLMYLTQSNSALDLLKSMNQGNTDTGNQIESKLVTLLSFDSDPYQQVEKLNSDIKFNAGWLNKLLDISVFVTPIKEKKVDKNRKKRAESFKVEGSGTEAKEYRDDGWGSSKSESPTTNSNQNDDWGSSNSGSKDDDW